MSAAVLPEAHFDPSVDRFRSLLDRYTEFSRRAGKHVRRSEPEKGRKMFLALPENQRELLLARLEKEIQIFEAATAAEEPLANPSRQLWRYLSMNGLTPCSDFFGKLSETDTIHVYSLDQLLVFVSLNFFDHVSYTLEQIFCQIWHQATRRDPAITEQLSVEVGRLIRSDAPRTFDPRNPWHLVEELDTELSFKYLLRVKWISPLFSDRKLAGFVAVVGFREANAQTEPMD
jgi:hypothetical protein